MIGGSRDARGAAPDTPSNRRCELRSDMCAKPKGDFTCSCAGRLRTRCRVHREGDRDPGVAIPRIRAAEDCGVCRRLHVAVVHREELWGDNIVGRCVGVEGDQKLVRRWRASRATIDRDVLTEVGVRHPVLGEVPRREVVERVLATLGGSIVQRDGVRSGRQARQPETLDERLALLVSGLVGVEVPADPLASGIRIVCRVSSAEIVRALVVAADGGISECRRRGSGDRPGCRDVVVRDELFREVEHIREGAGIVGDDIGCVLPRPSKCVVDDDVHVLADRPVRSGKGHLLAWLVVGLVARDHRGSGRIHRTGRTARSG